jgi:hypothetical protein
MLFRLALSVLVIADLKTRSVEPARTLRFLARTPEMAAARMLLNRTLATSPPPRIFLLGDEALACYPRIEPTAGVRRSLGTRVA